MRVEYNEISHVEAQMCENERDLIRSSKLEERERKRGMCHLCESNACVPVTHMCRRKRTANTYVDTANVSFSRD